MKHQDPMTKQPLGSDTGAADMPHAGSHKRVSNSTSNNPASKPGRVKGTPKANKKYKHVKAPRY